MRALMLVCLAFLVSTEAHPGFGGAAQMDFQFRILFDEAEMELEAGLKEAQTEARTYQQDTRQILGGLLNPIQKKVEKKKSAIRTFVDRKLAFLKLASNKTAKKMFSKGLRKMRDSEEDAEVINDLALSKAFDEIEELEDEEFTNATIRELLFEDAIATSPDWSEKEKLGQTRKTTLSSVAQKALNYLNSESSQKVIAYVKQLLIKLTDFTEAKIEELISEKLTHLADKVEEKLEEKITNWISSLFKVSSPLGEVDSVEEAEEAQILAAIESQNDTFLNSLTKTEVVDSFWDVSDSDPTVGMLHKKAFGGLFNKSHPLRECRTVRSFPEECKISLFRKGNTNMCDKAGKCLSQLQDVFDKSTDCVHTAMGEKAGLIDSLTTKGFTARAMNKLAMEKRKFQYIVGNMCKQDTVTKTRCSSVKHQIKNIALSKVTQERKCEQIKRFGCCGSEVAGMTQYRQIFGEKCLLSMPGQCAALGEKHHILNFQVTIDLPETVTTSLSMTRKTKDLSDPSFDTIRAKLQAALNAKGYKIDLSTLTAGNIPPEMKTPEFKKMVVPLALKTLNFREILQLKSILADFGQSFKMKAERTTVGETDVVNFNEASTEGVELVVNITYLSEGAENEDGERCAIEDGEMMFCTEAMQKAGVNCVTGACIQTPENLRLYEEESEESSPLELFLEENDNDLYENIGLVGIESSCISCKKWGVGKWIKKGGKKIGGELKNFVTETGKEVIDDAKNQIKTEIKEKASNWIGGLLRKDKGMPFSFDWGSAIGGSIGGKLGSSAGSALGGAIGGPIGAYVGGAVGGAIGGYAGSKAGGWVENKYNSWRNNRKMIQSAMRQRFVKAIKTSWRRNSAERMSTWKVSSSPFMEVIENKVDDSLFSTSLLREEEFISQFGESEENTESLVRDYSLDLVAKKRTSKRSVFSKRVQKAMMNLKKAVKANAKATIAQMKADLEAKLKSEAKMVVDDIKTAVNDVINEAKQEIANKVKNAVKKGKDKIKSGITKAIKSFKLFGKVKAGDETYSQILADVEKVDEDGLFDEEDEESESAAAASLVVSAKKRCAAKVLAVPTECEPLLTRTRARMNKRTLLNLACGANGKCVAAIMRRFDATMDCLKKETVAASSAIAAEAGASPFVIEAHAKKMIKFNNDKVLGQLGRMCSRDLQSDTYCAEVPEKMRALLKGGFSRMSDRDQCKIIQDFGCCAPNFKFHLPAGVSCPTKNVCPEMGDEKKTVEVTYQIQTGKFRLGKKFKNIGKSIKKAGKTVSKTVKAVKNSKIYKNAMNYVVKPYMKGGVNGIFSNLANKAVSKIESKINKKLPFSTGGLLGKALSSQVSKVRDGFKKKNQLELPVEMFIAEDLSELTLVIEEGSEEDLDAIKKGLTALKNIDTSLAFNEEDDDAVSISESSVNTMTLKFSDAAVSIEDFEVTDCDEADSVKCDDVVQSALKAEGKNCVKNTCTEVTQKDIDIITGLDEEISASGATTPMFISAMFSLLYCMLMV